MRLLIAVLALVALAGCGKRMDDTPISGQFGDYRVIRLRGCEYIKCYVYAGSVLVHAGDCDNPIHKEARP